MKIRLQDADFWRLWPRKHAGPAVEVELSFKDILFDLRFASPAWKFILPSLLLALAAAVFGALSPLSGKVLIDYVLQAKPPLEVERILHRLHLASLIDPLTSIFRSLDKVVLLGLAAGLLVGAASLLRNYLQVRAATEITFNVQTALFDRVLRFPLALLKKKQVGYLMSRITGDVQAVQSLFSVSTVQVLVNMLAPLLGFFVLFQLNTRITLVLLAIVPFNVLVNHHILRRSMALGYRQMEETAHYTGDMQEALSGVEVVKSYGAEAREATRVAGTMRRVLRLQLRGTLLQSAAGQLLSAYNLGIKLFIVWLCGRAVLKGSMTVGDLTSFTLYALSLSSMLARLFSQVLSFQALLVPLARLHEMFRIAPEFEPQGPAAEPPRAIRSKGVPATKPLLRPESLRGKIEFRRVSFAYDDRRPVLKDVTFTVRPGETVALMGASGVGKTTLISLLLKFHRPQAGTILVDGRDLETIDTSWLRARVGIVSQETFLFNDTVEHNILYGNPAASFEEVKAAAHQAHVAADIEGFPKGYKTVVGERGAELSAGQRQRLSLARAFLKDPGILILDEPTSALDRATECRLGGTLRSIARSRTTFMITHREPLLGIADRVMELRDGRLRELRRPGRPVHPR